jgi:L-glyceraldehyde 3-phosphate reductase
MGLEYVDIFYSHRPDPETPVEETMGALDQAVRSGKALYAGVSNYNASQTAAAVKILRELGTPCLIHQMRYSIFQRAPEQGLLDVLGKEGVGAIAFCPLAQGLLTDRYLRGIPADSRATKEKFLKTSDIDEHRLTQIRALNELAARRGQSLAQMALAWVLRDGRMTSALIGASRVEQIEQNVAALANLSFSVEELAGIDAIVGQAG